MPIVFPAAILEKIVEKVVEKIEYVAVSTIQSIKIAHVYLMNVILPSVNVMATTIAGIKNTFVPPYLSLITVIHKLISKPAFPSASLIGQTIFGILLRVAGLRLSLPKLTFRVIYSPVKPTVSFILGIIQPFIGRSVMDVKKPTISLRIVSYPTKPYPSVAASVSTSVGVRKSP